MGIVDSGNNVNIGGGEEPLSELERCLLLNTPPGGPSTHTHKAHSYDKRSELNHEQ